MNQAPSNISGHYFILLSRGVDNNPLAFQGKWGGEDKTGPGEKKALTRERGAGSDSYLFFRSE